MHQLDVTSLPQVEPKLVLASSKETAPMTEKEKKLFSMLLTITGVYAFCYTPLMIALVFEVITSQLVSYWYSAISLNLVALNASVNPFLLYFLDPLVRAEVNYFFGIYRKSRSGGTLFKPVLSPVSPNMPRNMLQMDINSPGDTSPANCKDTVKLEIHDQTNTRIIRSNL
jgi:hypothetical protein